MASIAYRYSKLEEAAIEKDDLLEVTRLVQNGTDVNSVHPQLGITVLHTAALNVSIKMIEHLVNLGADINARDFEQRTPLCFALLYGLKVRHYTEEKVIELIDCLVKFGADVNAKSNDDLESTGLIGTSPLLIAFAEGKKEIMKHLVELGADVNATFDKVTPLHAALKTGNLEMVENLLKHGANIVIDNEDMNCSTGGIRALHVAAAEGNIRMFEHLVNLGADINARDSEERTPLHYALKLATRNNPVEKMTELVDCLVKLGADINARNSEDRTPLCFALIYATRIYPEDKMIELFDCLVKLGADVEAKSDSTDVSSGSLHRAIRNNDISAVKELARSGKLREEIENERLIGVSSLFIAFAEGKKVIMKHLVKLGANINATFEKVLPLHTAVKTGNLEIVEILLEHGADIHSWVHNDSLVTFAIKSYFDTSMFTLLADLGADFNLPVTFFCSIHEAVELGKLDMVNCLLNHSVKHRRPVIKNSPPIIEAIRTRPFDLDLLKLLVRCGADINARYDGQITTLELAVRKGNEEIIAALVEHGEGIDTVPHFGTTDITVLVDWFLSSMHRAFTNTNLRGLSDMKITLKELIRLGGDVNVKYNRFCVLHNAVARGATDMVKVLVKLGADINSLGHCHGYAGETILNAIVLKKAHSEGITPTFTDVAEELITTLVEGGADINSGYDTVLPIHIAVQHSDTKMVQTLHTLGANLNQAMRRGAGKPIFTAPDKKYILKLGANPNAENIDGIEPLLEALRLGDAKMVQCLLDCGVKRTARTQYDKTNAIHHVILEDNHDGLKDLIKAGAALRPKTMYSHDSGALEYLDEEGTRIAGDFGIFVPKKPYTSNTLIMKYLQWHQSTDMLQTLLSNGANKNDKENVGVHNTFMFSNLDAACNSGNLDIVRLLIFEGSDVNELDSHNQLPFRHLPLRTCVKYHTLNETRTAEKVIERVDDDFDPTIPHQTMESLLCTPGLGDVKSIEVAHPNCAGICEDIWRILFKIGKEIALFSKLIGCGSASEGTKVGLPDELDFLAEVCKLSKTQQKNIINAKHDYVHYFDETPELNKGSKEFHTSFAYELATGKDPKSEYAVGFPTRNGKLIFHIISQAVSDANRRATSPLIASFDRKNMAYRLPYVSVDVVPSLHVENSWPEGGINQTWLLSPEELRQHGYYLVPKPPHAHSDLAKQYKEEELRTLWKISFPHLETYHMLHLEKRVKDVYVLAKCLRDPDVCRIMITDKGSYPKNISKYITSYMLKMIFFKNVENFLGSDLSLGEMVCQVYDGVEEGLSQGFIPLYFMPKVNSLGGHKLNLPKCAKVARTMKRFVHALYSKDTQKDPDTCRMGDADVVTTIVYQRKPMSAFRCIDSALRDCQNDPEWIEDEDEDEVTAILYQRKPTSVYRCFEVALPEEMPETKLWDVDKENCRTSQPTGNNRKTKTTADDVNDISCEYGTIHHHIICDGCEGQVRGVRYKCSVCRDYDLCWKCKRQGKHPEHLMIALRRIEDRK